MAGTPRISLLLSDVDGTLVDENKALTERTVAAVAALREANVLFAVTSARPPRGMRWIIDELGLEAPTAGFNGGLYVDADMTVLEERSLLPDIAAQAADTIRSHGLDVWVFRGHDWLVSDPEGAYVDHEARTVRFGPMVVGDVTADLSGIAKMVGVSDDFRRVEEAERAAAKAFGDRTTVARSQAYYLDVTHADANKGAVVDYLSSALGIPAQEIATIGDQFNDVRMFKRSGFSIAMGNAPDAVKAEASVSTASNRDDGFAEAVERFVLGAERP